ncbi:MAG: xanthine dehydrogenase family protein subunit M [Candidatus Bathyarchaeia archaeon]|jgi:carbon-monoxide dehydrogenase medium subunit
MSINTHDTHILHSFQYYAPTSVTEAAKLLDKHGVEAVVLAGGTDLLPKMKQALLKPRQVINLKQIPELVGVREEAELIRIGALTRLRDLERSIIVTEKLPLLHAAVSSIGSVQIRNMATVGGNLCNASPAADSAQALIALDAKANIAGPSGDRSIELESFFTGPGRTVLGRGELLASLIVPYPEPGSQSAFIKLGRTSLDLATVSIAVNAKMKKETIESIKIVMGAVAPTPLRLRNVEQQLMKKKLNMDAIEEAGRLVSESIKPITDIRGTAEYRRLASRGLAMEALTRILEDSRRDK